MRRTGQHARVRQKLTAIVNGYVELPAAGAALDAFICPSGLGSRSGALGALPLGKAAYAAQH